MSGKKKMSRYSDSTKDRIIAEQRAGASVRFLSRSNGISRYVIPNWCGLRPEVALRHATPLPKGRPKQAGNKQANNQAIKDGE